MLSSLLGVVNREVTKIQDRNGVRLSAAPGNGLAWVEGTDFRSGTIEVDIRGKEVMQQSFVGVAFHRKDDNTYEAAFLRPFNFRAQDPIRKQHAVQYITPPEFDWPRLRKEFPEEFENPVDASIVPTDGSSSAWSLKAAKFRSMWAPSRRSRSKCGSLASSMAARSGCGWATAAVGTSRISPSRRRNNDVAFTLQPSREARRRWSCRVR